MLIKIDILRLILKDYGFACDLLQVKILQEMISSNRKRVLYLLVLSNFQKLVCRISCENDCSKKITEQQCQFSEMLRCCGIQVAAKYKAKGSYCKEYFYDSMKIYVTLEEYVGTDYQCNDLKSFRLLGLLLGEMHLISSRNPIKIDCSVIGSAIKSGDARFSKLISCLDVDLYNSDCIIKLSEKHDKLVEVLSDFTDDLPHGAVHGDLGVLNNFCVRNGRISIIDFNLAGDEPYLFDMLSCVYSSIHKVISYYNETVFDKEAAFSEFMLGYCAKRNLSSIEKDVFGCSAALFNGLYYCKSIIAEYKLGRRDVLNKFKMAHEYFEVHKYRI